MKLVNYLTFFRSYYLILNKKQAQDAYQITKIFTFDKETPLEISKPLPFLWMKNKELMGLFP